MYSILRLSAYGVPNRKIALAFLKFLKERKIRLTYVTLVRYLCHEDIEHIEGI